MSNKELRTIARTSGDDVMRRIIWDDAVAAFEIPIGAELVLRSEAESLAAQPEPAAQDIEDDWSVEAAAMKLAEVMDYPWANMPDEGRMRMRRDADAVVRAARAATKPQGGA